MPSCVPSCVCHHVCHHLCHPTNSTSGLNCPAVTTTCILNNIWSLFTHSKFSDRKISHKAMITNFQMVSNASVTIYNYTTTTDHHHTVQVAWVQVQYLRQWKDEKAPPAQVAEGDATTCASGLSALVPE